MTALAATPLDSRRLLPTDSPLGLLDADGALVPNPGLPLPSDEVLLELHRRIVLGRRFDTQATALTKQGRLAVYPSSRGQEAGEIGRASCRERVSYHV